MLQAARRGRAGHRRSATKPNRRKAATHRSSSSSAFTLAVTIGEAGVAETRADRQDAPTFHVLHKGDFGQPLHDAVVVHDNGRVMPADLGDGFDKTCR